MQLNTQPDLINCARLAAELEALAGVAASDGPFLSCYLDARAGKAACMAFLEQKGARIRTALKGSARLGFDSALMMLTRQIDQTWHPEVKGIALFARGPADGRHLSALPFAVPLQNRLVSYRLPELLPLLELQLREPAFSLLLARRRRVQLLDVDLGVTMPRAWVTRPEFGRADAAMGRDGQPTRERGTSLDRSLQLVRRALWNGARPLVVAGDAGLLSPVADWLPQRVKSRVVDHVVMPVGQEQREVIARARARLTESRLGEANMLAGRLVNAMRVRGPAVAGQLATLEALHAGAVETLLIADGGGGRASSHWDSAIELSHLACRQGVRVVPVNSEDLRYLGGVGCLLRQRADSIEMPLPVRHARLDLVA